MQHTAGDEQGCVGTRTVSKAGGQLQRLVLDRSVAYLFCTNSLLHGTAECSLRGELYLGHATTVMAGA